MKFLFPPHTHKQLDILVNLQCYHIEIEIEII